MSCIVEVISAGDVGVAMSQMRTWLDHYRFQVENFRHFGESAGSKFRLEFSTESEAAAFASAFGGRVLYPEPQLAPLIRMPPAPTRLYRHRLHGSYSRSRAKRLSG
jgi:hypothetical protein